MTPPVPRTGARLLLLDPDDRVLLVHEAGDDDGGGFDHWLTPGGGVEDGETLLAAVEREVAEETGVRVNLRPDAVKVHEQRRRWSWRGVTYDQTDHFFVARVAAAFEPHPLALTEMERDTVLGARWWTRAQIAASDAVFLPPDLPEVLDRVSTLPLTRPVQRPAGRMLVLDPHNRVLMIDSLQEPGGRTHNWVAPGGGCDAGESPREAALRELKEETGLRVALPIDAAPVFVEHAVFPVASWVFDQTDTYFLAHVAADVPVNLAGVDEVERAMTLGYRWWTAGELRATSDLVWPVGLADLLDSLPASS